jgi:release factor glutamine methyltransferase
MTSRSPSAARLLERGAEELARAGVDNSRREAELLLGHALGWSSESLLARLPEAVNPEAAGYFFHLLERRRGRVPLQYLIGEQEFWGLSFRVTPAVLIPRPETEGLVRAALDRLAGRPARVADVGCGSGCIAVVLARELPEAQIYATDISPAALAVARENTERYGLSGRIRFLQGDLLDPLIEQDRGVSGLDAVLSNPPYVAEPELEGLQPEVRDHEPRVALAAGPEGLDVIRRLLPGADALLVPGGYLILEMAMGMESRVRALLGETRLAWEATLADLAGIPRVLVARKER